MLNFITETEDKVHVSRLRPYLTDRTGAIDATMREGAMMDYLYDYPIERILRHEGIPTGRRQLKF